MTEPPPVVPPPGPRVLPRGRYVALWAGVCVLGAVVGAAAKNYGPELGGAAGRWAGYGLGSVVVLGACVAIARRVGNPTAPVLCGVLLGSAAMGPTDELKGLLGGERELILTRVVGVFAVYLLWARVVHPRLAGRRTP